jgi:SAM-dependent methyltransferase
MRDSRLLNLQSKPHPSYSGVSELWFAEVNLKNYNIDLVKKLSRYCSKDSTVMEFGAGIGTLAEIMVSITKIKPDCLEIDPDLKKIILERGFNCFSGLDATDKKYDLIYTSNVLEHIKEDLDALIDIKKKLNPLGILAIYVPAFELLYSHTDAAIGHYRRYSRRELMQKLLIAGYEIEHCYYADSIGFFAWLYHKIKGRNSDEKLDGESMRIYDKYIFPISKFLDLIGFRFLFGKNLLVYARKL